MAAVAAVGLKYDDKRGDELPFIPAGFFDAGANSLFGEPEPPPAAAVASRKIFAINRNRLPPGRLAKGRGWVCREQILLRPR